MAIKVEYSMPTEERQETNQRTVYSSERVKLEDQTIEQVNAVVAMLDAQNLDMTIKISLKEPK